MSHRAFVAFETETGRFDLHYSHMGAQDFYLGDILADALSEMNRDAAAAALPRVMPDRLQQIKAPDAADPAIDADPLRVDVPLSDIGDEVAFVHFEALYLVRDGDVETYVPVWMYPDVLDGIASRMSLGVYRSNEVPADPSQAQDYIEKTDTWRTVNMGTLPDRLDDDSYREMVETIHQPCLSLFGKLVEQMQRNHSEQLGSAFQDIPPYFIQILPFGQQLPYPNTGGDGLFVSADAVAEAESLSLAEAGYRIQEYAAARRVDHGETLMQDDEATYHDEKKGLAVDLFKEFTDSVAPFSPDPYGEAARTQFGTGDS